MKYSGKKAENIYGKCVLIGLGVTILCVILGAMLLTTFVISGSIEEGKTDVGIVTLLFVSSAIGSVCVRVTKGEGSTKAILILLGCSVALGVLSNVIFYGGEFDNILWKIAPIVIGSIVAMLRKKDKHKKYRSIKN